MMQPPNYAPGVRDAALQLRDRANHVATVISRLDSQVASMTYSGPSADRFRASMADHRAYLLKVHGIITQTADAMLSWAQRNEGQPGIGGMG